MTSSALRKIRIFFSVLTILLLSAIFLDIRHLIPEKFINTALWLQFIPSANKYISLGITAAAGFIAVIVLTFITGRSYCSFLCPLGILQDVFSRIGGRIKRKFRKFGFRKPHTFIRYTLLAATLVITLVWGSWILVLLDPYSIFGRFMTFFAKPAVVFLNNQLSHLMGHFDIFTFVHQHQNWFVPAAYIIPSLFLVLIAGMSLTRGRLFCNMICPVGTFLGLLSKISVFRIKIRESSCSRCGRCAIACKSSCIDFLNRDIDYSRCVGCFNCITSCPDKAVEYGLLSLRRKGKIPEAKTDESRREMITGALFMISGFPAAVSFQEKKAPVPQKASTIKENRTCPVSPPGSVSIKNFTSNCTACSLCIAVCPNNVLVPSVKQYGIASVMQPHLDFHKGFCAYECVRCIEVCPTGAMLPLAIEAKKLTQIGKAVFIEDNCIVKTEKTACGACAESCPTKAVHMIPYEGKLMIPETTDDICIGCGHCEYACPTIPYKAIYINGNPGHAAARKPVNVKTDLTKPDEFPF